MSVFIPSQIVALDYQNKSLYCEVIDACCVADPFGIASRDLCWVRPIILVDKMTEKTDYLTDKNDIYDLRFTSDLLWNIKDFRIVLDTEYIEFLVNLSDFEFDDDKLKLAREKLKLFIKEIC
ncbi:hypothetical protein VKI21_04655 [Cyanobacterium aponinum UTEX 3222]|uniref:Uncharacterized protein n=2 Tax=Cyanobacterium aponinum TaxID=379064 RepID=K9Z9G6_CYAAP|nr:hypothetical protein [Cyanobacterium aponinum]MTF39962.1 hypothetical protein [Cyanobacterium aponinum 0216]WRL42978.1 hypothetical protein VKI21_04655 [Cyanobacterium aponinum UTEX 3222]AFZ55033.1 hypothetical protein Cyan10605_2973 [Cyanobacterium aponinum PCC 10605]MBD2394252.1 hypothetical protein [Cyanobacterium aponinum FACHB-4101]WRL40089.1 hypothetical protein VKI22_08435 [Cyanobacterium aponinum UTEX 3221]